jgi:curved DNA-binding protein CbpA
MTDHFAVLRQPRRPWLDPEQLKQEYQQLARIEHPDQKGPVTTEVRGVQAPFTFSAVNEAYRVLSSPRLRLQHLLSLQSDIALQSGGSDVPAELAELFMQVASLVRDIEQLLLTREQTTSAVGKSLFVAKIAPLRTRVEESLQQLDTLYSDLLRDLQYADQIWMTNPSEAVPGLHHLAQRFGYLERWVGQLREKQFQLTN